MLSTGYGDNAKENRYFKCINRFNEGCKDSRNNVKPFKGQRVF